MWNSHCSIQLRTGRWVGQPKYCSHCTPTMNTARGDKNDNWYQEKYTDGIADCGWSPPMRVCSLETTPLQAGHASPHQPLHNPHTTNSTGTCTQLKIKFPPFSNHKVDILIRTRLNSTKTRDKIKNSFSHRGIRCERNSFQTAQTKL